ncbi:hypothetical protein CDAR_222211 [Caerostris darwini]|uniref:Uncharacterized protein n=1 Tax=Caerostris darwini TaxID=1538125 RepID=A0AAV4P4F8_9ARAC|nr:hypothetical protein CDAR_222211 [Caerostris darwini]
MLYMYKRCPVTDRLRVERRRSKRIFPSSETTTNSGSRFKNLSSSRRIYPLRMKERPLPDWLCRIVFERNGGGVSESFHHQKQRQTAEVALKIYPLLRGGGVVRIKEAPSSRLALSDLLRVERRTSGRIFPSSETTTNSGSRFKNLYPALEKGVFFE